MKYLILMNVSHDVISFRAKLIEFLQQQGHSVVVIAHDDKRKEDIEALNVKFYCVEQNNRGLNPFSMLSYKRRLAKIMQSEKPDVVFTFQLKPNTFGVFAAKKAGVENIYSLVEGAGDVFIHNSLKWKLIRSVVCFLYKRSLKHSKKVFFLNNDDKAEFLRRKLVQEEKCQIVHGVGVDVEHFTYAPLPKNKTFLMIARMLRAKGVIEYCKCARAVKEKYPDAVFNYLGREAELTLADIKEYIDDGSICYLGTTKDVRPYLQDCLAYLLPSYREGFPMSIMEAEATGRPIITTNAVGCKEAVIDGYNGFLVEKGDDKAMAEKCIFAIENYEKMEEMGKNARKFAEDNCDCRKINQLIYEVIR